MITTLYQIDKTTDEGKLLAAALLKLFREETKFKSINDIIMELNEMIPELQEFIGAEPKE